MKFTIGYIEHNKEVFDKYLGLSLSKLDGDFDIISTSDKNKPAFNYNEVLKKSKNQYVILTHQDISFSPNLLDRIEKTIKTKPNFGVLGLVGVDSNKNYYWSSSQEMFELQTLDCCFIVVNKHNNIYFDQETFDDYHLYVEDFCLQTKKVTGFSPYTILIDKSPNSDSFLCHHSQTIKQLGPAWGKYKEYKNRLITKWGYVKTT